MVEATSSSENTAQTSAALLAAATLTAATAWAPGAIPPVFAEESSQGFEEFAAKVLNLSSASVPSFSAAYNY